METGFRVLIDWIHMGGEFDTYGRCSGAYIQKLYGRLDKSTSKDGGNRALRGAFGFFSRRIS